MEAKVTYDIFHLVYWDWRVVLDFFFGGVAVGAFLYAIGLMFYRKNDQMVTVKVGSILGPAAMIAGLSFLLSEMGHPIRIYKTITGFNITSTMSWGGGLQLSFIAFSTVFAVMLFSNKSKNVRWNMGMFAGFFALFVTFYQGFLLSFATARPLWNAGAVSVVAVFLSLNTGIAAVLLLTSFSKKAREEMQELVTAQGKSLNHIVKFFLLISILTQLTTCFIWIVTLMTGKADFVNAYHVLNQKFGFLFWIGAIGIGLVLPFTVLAIYSSGIRRNKPIPVFLTTIPILVGGFIFRYVLVLSGQIS